MQDIAYIRLVDPHPERIGRDHHPGPVIDKILLARPARLRAHACMVSSHRESRVLQFQVQLVHSFSRGAVDDPAFLPVLFYIAADLFLLVSCSADLEVKIFPVESGDRLIGLFQFKRSDDILPHPLCRRRGKRRDHRPRRKPPDEVEDPHIARTEILSPLGDAVRLIHSDHGELRVAGKVQKPRRLQSLRSHIDDLVPSCFCQFQRLCDLSLRQGTVDVGRVDPRLVERLHLVHHQRDQRRHHHRDPRHQKRRQLIAQRLPGAGRHDCKDVPPGEDLVDDLLLSRPEGVISKVCFKRLYFE